MATTGKTRTSRAAILSLIAGLLFCVPLLTSLAAVVTGVVGLRATRRPDVGGRGLAIAGLILGLFGLGFWGLIGVGAYALYLGSGPARQFTRDYVRDVTSGEIDSAAAASQPDQISRDDLNDLHRYLSDHGGAYHGLSFNRISGQNMSGVVRWELGGTASFDSGPAAFSCEVVSTTSGYRMRQLHFNDQSGTWPRTNGGGTNGGKLW